MAHHPLVDGAQQAVLAGLRDCVRQFFVGAAGQVHQHAELLALAHRDRGHVQVPGRAFDDAALGGVKRADLGRVVADLFAELDILQVPDEENRICDHDVHFAAAMVLDAVEGVVVAIAPADLDVHAAVDFLNQGRIQRAGLFQRLDRCLVGHALRLRYDRRCTLDHLGGVVLRQIVPKALKGRIADVLKVQGWVQFAQFRQNVVAHYAPLSNRVGLPGCGVHCSRRRHRIHRTP